MQALRSPTRTHDELSPHTHDTQHPQLSTFAFSFPVALTLLHALFTAGGMEAMCRGGLFARKAAPAAATLPVAAAYVGSIVLSNWSIHLNTVGAHGRIVISLLQRTTLQAHACAA